MRLELAKRGPIMLISLLKKSLKKIKLMRQNSVGIRMTVMRKYQNRSSILISMSKSMIFQTSRLEVTVCMEC